MSGRTDKALGIAADLWADFADAIEENPRGAAIIYVLGLITCAVGVLLF